MELTETIIGIGLGGLASWDGAGWVNVLDDQLQTAAACRTARHVQNDFVG